MRWIGSGLSRAVAGRNGFRIGLALIVVSVLLTVGFLARPRSAAVMPGPEPLRGSLPYATLLCRFSGPSSTDSSQIEPASYYDRLMVGGVGSLDDYWRQVSYGAINLQGSKAFGWFQMQKPASAYARPDLGRADLDSLARDCSSTAEAAHDPTLHFADYVGLNLVLSECVDRSRGGAIDLTLDGRTRNYRVTWLCPGYASSHQIVGHEMGHSFGLTHSEDSQGAEYGNNWDVMSNAGYCAATTDLGTLAQQPIAYDKDVLGWIAPGNKYTVRQPGVVTIQLDYLEIQPAASPGFLLAQIPLPGGRFYTVEARSRNGYDNALPAAGVLIHEIDPRRDNRARLITGSTTVGPSALLSSHGGWPVGSAFVDADNNIGVSVDDQVGGGYVVTLYTGAIPWPQHPDLQNVRSDNATVMQWRAVAGAQQYEIQVSHLAAGAATANAAGVPAPGVDWGATFVSDRPSLAARLQEGQYRWQVRALPGGPWSPPQVVTAGKVPAWRAAEQVAQVDGSLGVAPMVSASASGGVDVAWAEVGPHRTVSVARAALQGSTWSVQDLFSLPSSSRRGLALSFTAAGDLKLVWPSAAIDGIGASMTPAVTLDAGGRAHAIWAGAQLGQPGLFSAVVDSHAPSAAPAAAPRVQPVPVSSDAPGSAKSSPALALDRNGNARAVWVDTRDGRSAVFTAQEQADGAWSPEQRISDPNETVIGRPAIAVDAAGNAYAVWQGSVDCGGSTPLAELSFAERPVGGDWQPAITLAVPPGDARLIDPVVAANDNGELYVAWGEAADTGYKLYSAYRSTDREWESPRLAADGQTDTAGLTLSMAINEQGDAYLTWAESRGGQTFVRFATTH